MSRRPPVEPLDDEDDANKGWRDSLVAFQIPNFRLLFAGRVTSNIARSMRVFIRGWIVLELTDSPALMGIVVSSLSWPMLVLPFIGGVMADRMDRKRLLQWTETLLTFLWAFVAMTVAFAAWDIGPEVLQVQWWHFIITSFVSGIIQSIGRPGHQAMIGSVVDKERMPSAVALDSISDTWPRLGGPALGALAIAIIGGGWERWGPWLFGGTAALQGTTALTIFLMKWQPAMDVSKTLGKARASAWTDFVDGMKLVRSHSVLLSLVSMGFAFTIFAEGAAFLLPMYARDVLGLGSESGALGFAFLNLCATFGTSAASVANVALANYSSRGKLLFAVGMLRTVTVIMFSQSTWLWLSAPLITINSGAGSFFRTSQRMLLQRLTPNEMRGRVMALDVFQQGLSPIGVLIWGVIAEFLQGHFGKVEGTQLTWLSGGIMYGVIIITFFTLVPGLRQFKITGRPGEATMESVRVPPPGPPPPGSPSEPAAAAQASEATATEPTGASESVPATANRAPRE